MGREAQNFFASENVTFIFSPPLAFDSHFEPQKGNIMASTSAQPKLYYLTVFTSGRAASTEGAAKAVDQRCSAEDLNSYPWLQRSSIREFMAFTCQTIAERSKPGQQQGVEARGNMIYSSNENGVIGMLYFIEKCVDV